MTGSRRGAAFPQRAGARRGPSCAVAAALAAQLLLAPAPARAEQVKESHQILGAMLDITVESEDRETVQSLVRDAVAVAQRLEARLDLGDENSDVMRLNAKAGLGPVALPLDVYRLLALSQLMTRSTGGAFDVTVGPLLRRRQAGPGERAGRLDVDAALSLVGADKIVLHPPSGAELADAGMSVDFGGIAKGYVLERMAAVLRAGGVTSALLEFGDSTVLAIGPPAGEEPFRVWIPHGKSMAGSVALRDRSVSTSRARHRGDDSTRPPIVDPRSGRFVETDRQATVVARDAAIADAWSTALVVDPDGAIDLLEAPRDVEALVFDEHGEHTTPRFAAFASWKAGRKTVAVAEPSRSDDEPKTPPPARPE